MHEAQTYLRFVCQSVRLLVSSNGYVVFTEDSKYLLGQPPESIPHIYHLQLTLNATRSFSVLVSPKFSVKNTIHISISRQI